MSYIWKKHKQYKKNKRVVPGVVSTYSGIGARGGNGALGSLGSPGAGGATMSVGGAGGGMFVSTYSAGVSLFPQEHSNVAPTQCPKCKKKIKAGKKHKCDSGLRGLLKNV